MNVCSHPIYAEQRAGLAEDSDDLLYLAMAHPLADAAKNHQCSWLERWVVLECKPGIKTHTHTNTSLILDSETRPKKKSANSAED